MFSFWKPKKVSPAGNWGFLHTDIHSHILPGIDDGAASLQDSLNLIGAMQGQGFSKMVATPHISEDIYPNSRGTILRQRDALRGALKNQGIHFPVEAAAEYMIDASFLSLVSAAERLLTLDGGNGNKVLVEMSYLSESPYLAQALFALQTQAYQPVLAHPERYNFYHDRLEKYDELLEKGCLFQLNTISLSGYYGKHVQKTAVYLLRKKMYHYCGSDIHHLRHTRVLSNMLHDPVLNELESYGFKNREL